MPGSVPTPNIGALPDRIAGMMPDASQQAVDALAGRAAPILANNPGANPAAVARAADFKQLGIQPTLGQISRDPQQFTIEQNMRSASQPLTQRFNQQQQQLAAMLQQLTGNPDQAYPAGMKIANALQGYDTGLSGGVRDAYTAARGSAGAAQEIPLQGLAQDYAGTMRDFPNNVPGGIQNRFNELGLMSGTQRSMFNMDDAESLLKLINAHDGPMVDPATGTALGQLRNSVKGAIVGADQDGGPYAAARALAADRFSQHDQVPALSAVTSNRIAPDNLVNRFVTGGTTEGVQGLAQILQQADPQALAEMRSQLGGNLQTAGFGFNPGGDRTFAPQQYQRALAKLGDDKLGAVFSPDEIDTLHGIGRVGGYIGTEPAAGAVNRSNTGATVMDLAQHIPIAGKAVQSMLNRAAIAKALQANVGDTQPPFLTSPGNTLAAPLMINASQASSGRQ